MFQIAAYIVCPPGGADKFICQLYILALRRCGRYTDFVSVTSVTFCYNMDFAILTIL